QVQPRIGLVQNANDVQIPLVLHLVVQAADDVHLGAAALDRLAAALENLLVAHQITLRIAQVRTERAERAAIDADVRRVQMGIDVVVGEVAVLALADRIGQFAQFVEIDFRLIEKQSLIERQSLAGQDFAADQFEAGLVGSDHGIEYVVSRSFLEGDGGMTRRYGGWNRKWDT